MIKYDVKFNGIMYINECAIFIEKEMISNSSIYMNISLTATLIKLPI